MDAIIKYLKDRYEPLSIVVYGSYTDGSRNMNSDFDALVLSNGQETVHDVGYVEGIQLDVFVYPHTYFHDDVDLNEFIQIFDGQIVFDTENRGLVLKQKVLDYIESIPPKSKEENQNSVAWCKKMLLRVGRHDTEGMFRWHWVLVDSLEIFCDAVHHFYHGPKKALKWMEAEYPNAFDLYQNALFRFDEESLSNWIHYLEKQIS